LIQQGLELPSLTQMRDRAIVAVLSHGLRASEVSALSIEHWNGKVLTVHRSKGQNISEVPLSREARSHLQAYLDWRQAQGGLFELKPQNALFLAQDPKSIGLRLSYQGLHKMIKKLGAIAGVEALHPHRFRYSFGTEVTRRGVDPLFGKELMGIKSDPCGICEAARVFERYTKGIFKKAAGDAYLRAIGEGSENEGEKTEPVSQKEIEPLAKFLCNFERLFLEKVT
jgi:integrase/recombinase XerD